MLVKELRESKGMSREEFATEVMASFSSVVKWEISGKKIDCPTIGKAFRKNMAKLC